MKGPAGGIVFYDKGAFSEGWRYLEAAPVETEFTNFWYQGLAEKCRSLNYGGAGDWRLPDKEELGLMYQNLVLNGVGNFKGNRYVSSTNDGTLAEGLNFRDGKKVDASLSNSLSETFVRAIRAF